MAGDAQDQGLLAAARAGDGGSVAPLYDRHAGALYALARCVLGAGKAAEDAVVDAMVETCDPGTVGSSQPRSVRHELARASYQRCQASGPLAPAARARGALALCLHGDHTCSEAATLTGVSGASFGDLLQDAVADRGLSPTV